MELKPLYLFCYSFYNASINRTFMELKQRYNACYNTNRNVLIEPLWNWNAEWLMLVVSTVTSINRTFMELKLNNIFEQRKVRMY